MIDPIELQLDPFEGHMDIVNLLNEIFGEGWGVGGGWIRDCYSNQKRNDIDVWIFPRDYDWTNFPAKRKIHKYFLDMEFQILRSADAFLDLFRSSDGLRVQIIMAPVPKDPITPSERIPYITRLINVIHAYDFCHCQFFYYQGKSYALNSTTIEMEEKKELRVAKEIYIRGIWKPKTNYQLEKVIYRVNKFIQRGYKLQEESFIQIEQLLENALRGFYDARYSSQSILLEGNMCYDCGNLTSQYSSQEILENLLATWIMLNKDKLMIFLSSSNQIIREVCKRLKEEGTL